MAGAKHRLKMHKKAKGGKTTEYNAKGSPEMHEAEEKEDGFKHGGVKKEKKEKHAGHAEGKKAHHRLDKKKRGGANKMAKGGSPFTEASKVEERYKTSGAGQGHENDGSRAKEDD